jgi:glycine betaine catabolism B
MRVTFDHAQNEAPNIKTFFFRPESPVRYTAGQFIELFLPHDNPDERGIKHWFTLSSSPSQELLSITTKLAEKSSSFKRTLQALKPGDEVRMVEPMGDFVLPKDVTRPLVFVAGGIGITPMHSMIQWLHDNNEQRDITLIYAASTEDQLVFRDLFSSYKLKFIPILSQPSTDWTGETGKLDAARILRLIPKTSNSLIYLSGPEPMVETFVDDLEKAGIDKRRLVTDYFPGYVEI